MDRPVAFIVEGDTMIADIFAKAVESANYHAITIRDGYEALESLKKGTPALVVLNLRLPRIHGIHVLKAIRDDSRLSATRVIVVSAEATQTQFLRDEADLILIQPIGFNQLREMAKRLRPA
jgi:DNA-binding response OmpR family regulator